MINTMIGIDLVSGRLYPWIWGLLFESPLADIGPCKGSAFQVDKAQACAIL